MNGFEENVCRICRKTFCCKTCRSSHEEKSHLVNPDCEICIYGRTTIKEASVSLLCHIKTAHWPLHCVFCKKIFHSLDELVPHDKCVLRIETIKGQGTPKTPVTPVVESNEPSPEVTPFYKDLKTCDKKLPTWAATSTPLVHGNEREKDISQINYIHKSNLKFTGSSNLSDSKKSERRVTFSETPFVSEPSKKPKYLPMANKLGCSQEEDPNSTDESYVSLDDEDKEERFQTAPTTLENQENENINRNTVLNEQRDYSGSIWESALTKLDFNRSNILEQPNHFNVSVQINVFNSTTTRSDEGNSISSSDMSRDKLVYNRSKNIWSSMTDMVKSVIQNVSVTAQNSFSNVGIKRSQPDSDNVDVPSFKRMKLTELKCRPPIRDISPLYQIPFRRPRYVDKATQTDECWL